MITKRTHNAYFHDLKNAYDAAKVSATKKYLVMLLLDSSGSMDVPCDPRAANGKSKMDVCKESAIKLVEAVRSSPQLTKITELGIISYNEDSELVRSPSCVTDDAIEKIKNLEADGLTEIGGAYFAAVEELEKRESELKNTSCQLITPTVILLSDGLPEGHSAKLLEKAIIHAKDKKYNVVPILIGEESKNCVLSSFGDVISIENNQIEAIFGAIFTSIRASIGTASSNAFAKILKSAVTWSAPSVKITS